MLKTLSKPTISPRREFYSLEFRTAKEQIATDSHLKDAREALGNELFKEHVNYRTKNQIPRSDATYHFDQTFEFLDQAITATTSQETYSLRIKDERLGNTNKFKYFVAKAYLNLKRAFNEIGKEPLQIKQKRLLGIYTVLDEFITSKLLKFVKVGKLFDVVKREREQALEDYLYRG